MFKKLAKKQPLNIFKNTSNVLRNLTQWKKTGHTPYIPYIPYASYGMVCLGLTLALVTSAVQASDRLNGGVALDAGKSVGYMISSKKLELLQGGLTRENSVRSDSAHKNAVAQCDSTCGAVTAQIFTPEEVDKLRMVSCPEGYAGTKIERSTALGGGAYSAWFDVDTSGCYLE